MIDSRDDPGHVLLTPPTMSCGGAARHPAGFAVAGRAGHRPPPRQQPTQAATPLRTVDDVPDPDAT